MDDSDMDRGRSGVYAMPLSLGLDEIRRLLAELPDGIRPADSFDCLRAMEQNIAEQSDQMLLPLTADELSRFGRALIEKASHSGTPAGRYHAFWSGGHFSAADLAARYPVVATGLGHIISGTVAAVRRSIERFVMDLPLLRSRFADVVGRIVEVTPVGSDRHAGGGQVIRFAFDSGARLYYKPVCVSSKAILYRFVRLLDLPDQFTPYQIPTLNRGTYGWLGEAGFAVCTEQDQVHSYWARCGALLAACCFLNFSDGHYENLIAVGEHPALIDSETLLQNYAWRNTSGRLESVFDTGLVEQSDPQSPGLGNHSAFQVVGGKRSSTLTPYALNDGSDGLRVKFHRVIHEAPTNLPVLDGEYQTANLYLDELLNGFSAVFRKIFKHRERVLDDERLWCETASFHGRQVIRRTAYYAYLLRLTEQPVVASSFVAAEAELRCRLHSEQANRYNRLVDDEIAALLREDIPYFVQCPAEKDLIVPGNRRHVDFFATSAQEQVRANISEWDESFLLEQCSLLRDNLATEAPDRLLSQQDMESLGLAAQAEGAINGRAGAE